MQRPVRWLWIKVLTSKMNGILFLRLTWQEDEFHKLAPDHHLNDGACSPAPHECMHTLTQMHAHMHDFKRHESRFLSE